MKFQSVARDEPEINLIPFIDVLLVVLIFLMMSTSYSKFTEMQLKLPVADSDAQRDYPKELLISVSADGAYSINRSPVLGRSLEAISLALNQGPKFDADSKVIIQADANAKHQAVIHVMQAARNAGLSHIIFSTQSTAQAGKK
ncbi:MAG: biopolymer transporter ExbD [Burkholderiaceae bacterium]